MSEPTVRYFAFGANMARRVLVGRRGIVPLASCAARLDGYALRFTLRGVPFIEPAFASLVESPGHTMHGVLHTLHVRDLLRLDGIERPYDRVSVEVDTGAERVVATAYKARSHAVERAPSARYLRLLVEGAREHGLPEPWVDELALRESRHVRLLSPAVEHVLELGERALMALRRARE